jgi:phosphoribosylanthranilate isomerase
MRVKICGITNLKDAMDAINAGASALGFVFYAKSPRYIEPSEAKDIIKQLPPFVQSVGLFVNETAQTVNHISQITKIDLAQIHFEADDEFYNALEIKAIKVVRAKTKEDLNLYKKEYRIIDAFVPQYGGEGVRLNLDWFKSIDCSHIILAGGLTASNLKELKEFNFYALDVSSGVEVKKGIKDKQKIIDFINKANELSQ